MWSQIFSECATVTGTGRWPPTASAGHREPNPFGPHQSPVDHLPFIKRKIKCTQWRKRVSFFVSAWYFSLRASVKNMFVCPDHFWPNNCTPADLICSLFVCRGITQYNYSLAPDARSQRVLITSGHMEEHKCSVAQWLAHSAAYHRLCFHGAPEVSTDKKKKRECICMQR